MDLSKFITEKGSIAIDGVSLIVTNVEENCFKVVLIKHTLENTNFQYKKNGDIVSLEVDPLARYLKRLMEFK